MPFSRRDVLIIGSGAASLAAAGSELSLLAEPAATAGRWTLPARRPVRIVENEWIPMRDGVRLAARFWIPEGAEQTPVPVVFEYLPYRLWDGLRWRDDLTAANLSPYGVAFVRVDIRGTGNSEGVKDDEYSVPELDDGVQIIAWLARQSWSNGSVGMRGISWGGINSLQIAAMAPPQLKAIMPMGCCDIRYTDDAHYLGGAFGEQNLGWGVSFKGDLAGPPDPQVVAERWEQLWRARLEATPAIIKLWSEHQRYDAYWKRGSIAVDYAGIKCPVYVVDGWGDPYSNIIGRLLANLKVPRKGLIGPWGHIFPNIATPLGLEWQYEEVRWWQQWLMGLDTGIMQEPMLRVYCMHEADSQAFPDEVPGRWIAESVWPSPRSQSVNMYLDAGALLSSKAGARTHVSYVGDKIVGITKPQWVYGRPTELEQTPDDRNSLLFDSEVLAEDLEILGYPTAKLRVSANVPIAQCAVRLTEVTPDGKSWLVTYNLLNLTRRSSLQKPAPLVPGEFYDVEIPLYFIAHRFSKGNRLRVAISQGLWPLVWPSPQIATLNFVLGTSHIVLPVRPTPATEAPFTIPIIHAGPTTTPNTTGLPRYEPNGRISYQSEGLDQPTQTLVPAVGTTELAGGNRLWEIIEGQPTSCHMLMDRMLGWKRGDWECTVRFGMEMSSTADEFHLREWLVAMKGDQEIFRRETPSVIKRDLL
jgi:putative CocE/NonD family hydrolase